MKDFIPIAKPILDEEELNAIKEVLSSGMLTQGEAVKRFEDAFSDYVGVRNSIASSNGTVALDLALKAMDIGPGEEVISPAFTFIATSNAILYQRSKPVFADIDPRTFNIDSDDLQKKITPRTKAVIGVHLYGQPFDLRAVQEICEDHHLALIEDCAQAHGAEFDGRKVGGFGIGCFSFYPTKNMTTAEGGMITTNDDRLATKLRLLRNHGDTGKYNHIMLGYNYRMTNIQGAIGAIQLKKVEQFILRRIENAEFLSKNLKAGGISTPLKNSNVRHVYNQYVVKLEDDYCSSRDGLIDFLASKGIGSAVHYPMPVYRQPIYQRLGLDKSVCPQSEDVSRRVVSLPVHPSLSRENLEYIVETINSFEA